MRIDPQLLAWLLERHDRLDEAIRKLEGLLRPEKPRRRCARARRQPKLVKR